MEENTENLYRIFKKLQLVIEEQLEVDLDSIQLNFSFEDLSKSWGWEEQMELAIAIEEEFDIEIPDEKVDSWETVKDILAFLYFNDSNHKDYDIEIEKIEKILNRERSEKIRVIIKFINDNQLTEEKILEIIENDNFVNNYNKIGHFLEILNKPKTDPNHIVEFIDILNNQFFVNNIDNIKKILRFLDMSYLDRKELLQLMTNDHLQSHLNKIKYLKDSITQKSIEIKNKNIEKQILENEIQILNNELYDLKQQLKTLEQLQNKIVGWVRCAFDFDKNIISFYPHRNPPF